MGARLHRIGRARTLGGRLAGRSLAAVLLLVAGTATAGPVAAQDGGFRNGEASATADTFVVNVKQGNANIGFTYGRSIAGYRDRTGSAEARALDLGVLPTLFAVEQCDGSTPPMNPDTLPPTTRVDSTEPNAGASRRAEAFVPGYDGGPHGPSVGFQDATASPKPASRGTTESVDTDLGLLALDGGSTEVTTRLEGRVREARAVTRADELRVFGGLFTFTNPRWEAAARSGDLESNVGSFTFERATVLGVERTPQEALEDFAGFEYGLEQLLQPFGVQLDLPTVEVADGRVRVTPMAFRVVDPPFGSAVVAPFLGAIQPLREAAVNKAVAQDCRNALAITLLDVVLGVVAGSGSVEILAGGVDAFTADTDFTVPPLEPLPMLPPADPLPALDVAGIDLAAELPPPDAPVAELTATPAPRRSGSPERPPARSAVTAAATSRFEDSDVGRRAVAVGIAGVAGAVALSLAERFRSRRIARRTS